MDSAGFNWTLLTIVGPAILAVVILWALLRNRTTRAADEETERGTRQMYRDEDREHRGEADDVP